MNFLVYDIEISRGVPVRGEPLEPGIAYCAGWHDKANMGVSVVGAYDYVTDRYRVFCRDNLKEFETLAAGRTVVGFNSISFDDQVLAACGWHVTTRYDLLVEEWFAAGLGPVFQGAGHGGFGLDASARANGLTGKTGHGALAPVLWQRGQVGAVIDYCLEDVRLTKKLFDQVRLIGILKDPRDPSRLLRLRSPDAGPRPPAEPTAAEQEKD